MASIRKQGIKYQIQIRRKCIAPTVKSFHSRQNAQEWGKVHGCKSRQGRIAWFIKRVRSIPRLKPLLKKTIGVTNALKTKP